MTIDFPPDTLFPPIAGQWARQPDGTLRARYTPDELRIALEVADAITQRPPNQIDSIMKRYDSYGYPWLLRTPGGTDDDTGTV